MSTDRELEILKKSALFKDLSAQDLSAILAESRLRSAKEEEAFFFQGDPATHIYLLKAGRVKLSQVTLDGQQVLLNVIGPWEIFGLIGMTENAVYPVSATAAVDSLAYSWDKTTLNRLAARHPQLALNAMESMVSRVSDFQEQIRALATERVERRVARALLRLVRQVGKKAADGVLIDLNVSRQDLAEMSGTTLFTASRILSHWERMGLIEAGRERILIRNPHGIVSIAEDLPGQHPPEE